MEYGKYKNARNASWQCLIDYQITSLPVKVSHIVKNSENIRLIKNCNVKKLRDNQSGMTIKTKNIFNIIYRETDSPQRCRFTIAHELGHIFLGHLLINTPEYKTFAIRDDNESEANVFARDILAPACVLHELKIKTPYQISELCDISYEAAEYRIKRLQLLEMRNAWYLHPLERVIYKQFEEFIKSKKTSPKQ